MTDEALNVEATRENAFRIASPFSPITAPGKFGVAETNADGVASAFEAARGHTCLARPSPEAEVDPAVAEILTKFIDFIPRLHLAPAHLVPDHEKEFHWARVRCVFAGVGYQYNAPLATAVLEIYPDAPLDPAETYDDWYDAALAARNACGWPLSFSVAPFASVSGALDDTDRDAPIESWHLAFSALHLLKHVRRSPLYDGTVIIYRGTVLSLPASGRGNALVAVNDVAKALKSLGLRVSMSTKHAHPLYIAAKHLLDNLTSRDVLARRLPNLLPAQVLHGEWSSYAQDPSQNSGFVQHGVTIDGVRVASGGRVIEARHAHPSTDDIIGNDWNVHPIKEGTAVAKQQFLAAMVDSYDTALWPSDVLLANTPNLKWTDENQASLFDALLIAGVIRAEVPPLANEKPIVAFLPVHPTPDESTKQGKSAAAHAVARAIVLDQPLKIASRSTSAPDQRSLADGIIKRGTAYLDEWQLDPTPTAFLSKDNLQTMCTGGYANTGRVMENDEVNVCLRNFLTVSCKALNAPPDIVNRTFMFFLDNLTDEQFADGAKYDEAVSGRLSVRMRLAAIGKAEQHTLAGWLNLVNISGTATGTRFLRHRALAAQIISLKSGCSYDEGLRRADTAVLAMHAAHRNHTEEADSCGLLSMMETNSIQKTRMSVVFSDLDGKQAGSIQKCSQIISNGLRAGCSPVQILRARAEVAAMGNRPLSDLFRYLAGPGPFSKMSDRAIGLAVAKEFAAVMPNPGDKYVLPDLAGLQGWCIERQQPYHGSAMYAVVNLIPAHSANSTPPNPVA